jgi:hypothetical protein
MKSLVFLAPVAAHYETPAIIRVTGFQPLLTLSILTLNNHGQLTHKKVMGYLLRRPGHQEPR